MRLFRPAASRLLSIGLLAAFIVLPGCNPVKAKSAAAKGVQEFHARLDQADFSGIYQAADAELKKVTTEKDFIAFVAAVHRKLGPIQKSEEATWGINSHNLTTIVTLVYNTKFSAGDGTETFDFRVEGERAILVGYHINSMALITK